MTPEQRLTGQALHAIRTYYDYVEDTGYVKRGAVNDILALLFVEEIINSDMNLFLTDSDLGVMRRFLTGIYGASCFIDWPDYLELWPQRGSELSGNEADFRSDGDYLRVTNTGKLRTKEPRHKRYEDYDPWSGEYEDSSDEEES